MRIPPVTSLTQAIKVLADIAVAASNVPSQVFSGYGVNRGAYLLFVDQSIRALRGVFTGDALIDQLRTPVYWNLVAGQRPALEAMLIGTEIEQITQVITEAKDRLSAYLPLAQRTADLVVVPDTNVLLHGNHFDQVDWRRELGARTVRLMFVMPVIDELDDKKYVRRNDELKQRAVKVQRKILALLNTAETDGVAVLRDGVTVEILPELQPPAPAVNMDLAIIAAAQFAEAIAGPGKVTIATGDIGMLLRAKKAGLSAYHISAPQPSGRKKTRGPEQSTAQDTNPERDLEATIAALPPDRRPPPSVAEYDQLLNINNR